LLVLLGGGLAEFDIGGISIVLIEIERNSVKRVLKSIVTCYTVILSN
jgi:hypothetical protein